MCDNGGNRGGPSTDKFLGGFAKCSRRIGHIVDENGILTCDIANENHPRDLTRLTALFMDQSKAQVELVSERSRPLRSTSIRTIRQNNLLLRSYLTMIALLMSKFSLMYALIVASA